MPELPQMQALAERLDAALAGSTFEGAVALQFAALKTYSPDPSSLHGRTLRHVGRRGKYLILDLDGPRILVHLSQGGRVDVEDAPKATKPKGAVVRFRFAARPAVLVKEYGTERKAGWWVLAPGDDGPLAALGPEPDDAAFDALIRTGADRRRIHSLLRDQRTVAGIGRGYADDILHAARLSPYATLASLDDGARASLVAAVRDTLARAAEAERGRSGGLPAKLSDVFAIHGRWGSACPRCGRDLRRISFESHEITYCPDCQTGGKVLADRRMSRLVR